MDSLDEKILQTEWKQPKKQQRLQFSVGVFVCVYVC